MEINNKSIRISNTMCLSFLAASDGGTRRRQKAVGTDSNLERNIPSVRI